MGYLSLTTRLTWNRTLQYPIKAIELGLLTEGNLTQVKFNVFFGWAGGIMGDCVGK